MKKVSELTDEQKTAILNDLVCCLNSGRLRDAINGWTEELGIVTPNRPWEEWEGDYTPEAPSWVSLKPLGLAG